MSSDGGSPAGSPPVDDEPTTPQGAKDGPADTGADLSDDDSVLSDVDEAQFEDFDPSALELSERPVLVDEETVKLLGRHKRKRVEGEGAEKGEAKEKKKKEGRREKQRKALGRKKADGDEGAMSTEEVSGKRERKKADGEGKKKKYAEEQEVNEEELDPAERRRRALDRAMDAALRKPAGNRRRKHGDIDLTQTADEEIADLRVRMADAAAADVDARAAQPPRPAMHKLKLLPEVTALLNRNGREIENAIVDPENNLLESVRFFLEPLRDGSLPAYNIQRELFAALARLPVDKDALLSSGLGKVVVFYTKAKKVERPIQRAAERLLAEWTRPILKRSDDYRNRHFETRAYDPAAAALAARKQRRDGGLAGAPETPEQRRARQLAVPGAGGNRARVDVTQQSYTIVPQSTLNAGASQFARPMGAGGDDAFRRMRAAAGKGRR